MTQPTPKPSDVPASTTTLRRLEPLLGEWTTVRAHPDERYNSASGRARFEWLTKGKGNDGSGGFIVQREEVAHPDFPNSVTLIGMDATANAPDTFSCHYFDSRGVERISAMSLNDGVWKVWRAAPGFSQRFTGKFSSDGNTITVRLEKSRDGSTWEHDFDVIYTRVKAVESA